MEPEWSDFKVLVALARGGSVAGAARVLEVDSSTISRRLAALEEAVGARLIIRGGREFAWTAEGRSVLSAAEAMEVAVTAAARTVRAAKGDVDGSVRVSVSPGFVPVLMRHVLPALRARHPMLNVELSGDIQRVDLARGDADVAVRMALPNEPGLVARRAFDLSWFVYAARSHLDANGWPAVPDDLCRHPLIAYVESMHRVEPLRWMEAHLGASRQVSRVDNLEVACQAMAAGGGIAVLPCFIAEAAAGVVRVFPDRVSVNTGYVVFHEAARDTTRVRAVVDALVCFFETHAAMFSGCTEGAGSGDPVMSNEAASHRRQSSPGPRG